MKIKFWDIIAHSQSITYSILKVLILGTICGLILRYFKRITGIDNLTIELTIAIIIMFVLTFIVDCIHYRYKYRKEVFKKYYERYHTILRHQYTTYNKNDPFLCDYNIYEITVKSKKDNFVFTFLQYGKSEKELLDFWRHGELYGVNDNYEFLNCELYQKGNKK